MMLASLLGRIEGRQVNVCVVGQGYVGLSVACGAVLSFHDPFVESIDCEGLRLSRADLTRETAEAADRVVLLTPHSTYDTSRLAAQARLLFDARDAVEAGVGACVVTL